MPSPSGGRARPTAGLGDAKVYCPRARVRVLHEVTRAFARPGRGTVFVHARRLGLVVDAQIEGHDVTSVLAWLMLQGQGVLEAGRGREHGASDAIDGQAAAFREEPAEALLTIYDLAHFAPCRRVQGRVRVVIGASEQIPEGTARSSIRLAHRPRLPCLGRTAID
jgi:hypothetical protein